MQDQTQQAPLGERPGLLGPDYAAAVGARDELLAPGAGSFGLRDHWRSLFAQLEQLGGPELEGRRREAQRLFRENGVSYVSAANSDAAARAFELDPLPHLVPAEDWAVIDSGLQQRARLLEAILKDLYGPRHLIRGGLLPPQLLFRQGGFLLPVDGALAAEHTALTMYAADLARGSDGRFRVLADRTQSPSGPGLALETRIATSRILPNLIRGAHVHRLARFFRLMRENLEARAPHQKLDPRIVVLGGGPGDPNYFDHAYLAAYLGFPLVEGADLTVREGHLWLRTIEGLKLVDVVFRRVADHLCDPLELAPDSIAGSPGLLETARTGAVGVVNPLGAGILENPGLIPFLPQIARQVLGEELALDSVPTWWCGDPAGRAQVLEQLDGLVLKRIDRASGSVWGGSLSAAERDRWRARIERDGELFVGQAPALGATAPSLVAGTLEPRPVVTRCFVAAAQDGFTVMPGGFTRVVGPNEPPMGMGSGLSGVCKDTWVLAAEDERHLILWPTVTAPTGAVSDASLPSRAAESLFWVGRHAERAEFLTRLARVCLRKFNEARDYGDPADAGALTLLLRALRTLSIGQDVTDGELDGRPDAAFAESTLLETVRDGTLAGSLAATFRSLESAALAVRERWSTDTWRVIDDISEALEEERRFGRGGLAGVEDTLDRLVSSLVAFTGLTLESTTHEQGWQFLQLGRRTERALKTLRLLRVTVLGDAEEGVEHQLLEALLLTAESLMTHRRRYRAHLDAHSALQLLLLDTENPRSVAYQVLDLSRHVDALPRERGDGRLGEDQRALLSATTRLRLAEPAELLRPAAGRDGQRGALAVCLDELEAELEQTVAALEQAYFTHVQPAQQLVAMSVDSGVSTGAEIAE